MVDIHKLVKVCRLIQELRKKEHDNNIFLIPIVQHEVYGLNRQQITHVVPTVDGLISLLNDLLGKQQAAAWEIPSNQALRIR
jgi:hypothetical protein